MPITPNSTSVLTWHSMTAAINEVKPASSFVFNLLFSRSEPKDARTIELSYIRRGRQIAPFVKRGSAALMVQGGTEQFVVVEPPHIRIKRPMEPTALLNNRHPGSRIFVDGTEMRRAIDEYMAREIGYLATDIDETLEWMCAQALTGVISYTSLDQASFTITMPRTGTHSFDLPATEHWDEAGAHILEDFTNAMQLINDDSSVNPTDVILGTEAADAFLADPDIQALLKNNPNNAIITGNLSFVEQLMQSGAMYLGNPFRQIRVWRYGRTTVVNGVTVNLIRPKWAEFVSAVPQAENVTYYGAIEDFDAFGEGALFARERFAKSWTEPDPSVRISLAESNPLPCLRRPDTTVSMKVISG